MPSLHDIRYLGLHGGTAVTRCPAICLPLRPLLTSTNTKPDHSFALGSLRVLSPLSRGASRFRGREARDGERGVIACCSPNRAEQCQSAGHMSLSRSVSAPLLPITTSKISLLHVSDQPLSFAREHIVLAHSPPFLCLLSSVLNRISYRPCYSSHIIIEPLQ